MGNLAFLFFKKYERMMWMGMLSVVKAFKVLPKIMVKNGHKFMFAIKKASPELLVAGGLVASTVGFIWAIVNARKLDSTLQETQSKVELIEAKRNDIADNDKPSIHEWEKELNKAKAESIWKVFYLMGLPAICFIGGIAMVGGGHLMLFRRFGAVSSAFAALQSKFTRYRQLNIAEHGEECDQRYMYGQNMGTETIARIMDEDGVVTETKAYLPPDSRFNDGCSMYSFVFSDQTSKCWNRDPLINISFLRSQEGYWKACLGAGKVVTLKEVLDGIGIELDTDDPRNDFIYIAGWRPNGDGDGTIDFGIMREINKPALDLKDSNLFLDFNCDGNIYHSTRYTRDGKKISCQGTMIQIEDPRRTTMYDTAQKKYSIKNKQ